MIIFDSKGNSITEFPVKNGKRVMPTGGISSALRLDDTSTANVTYIGEAVLGSDTSDAVWRIKKLDETSGLVITWADGDEEEDNVWDDRVSLTYV